MALRWNQGCGPALCLSILPSSQGHSQALFCSHDALAMPLRPLLPSAISSLCLVVFSSLTVSKEERFMAAHWCRGFGWQSASSTQFGPEVRSNIMISGIYRAESCLPGKRERFEERGQRQESLQRPVPSRLLSPPRPYL